MPILNLTPQGKRGFTRLVRATDEAFDLLTDALSQPTEEVSGKIYIERIAGALSIGIADARLVYIALRALESDSDQRVDDIVETLLRNGIIGGETDDVEKFRRRLSLLRLPRQFIVFTKASTLLIRNERNFVSARGITDLRPVFGDDISTEPDAYVIEHQLQINFRVSDRDMSDLFIAMDEDDIDDLIEVLKRLKEKARTLKQHLKDIKMPYLVSNRV